MSAHSDSAEAPRNEMKNTGFWMARLISCMASATVWSLARCRPGMTETA
jgi:hypothetical protein